jgi:hypothetical protein
MIDADTFDWIAEAEAKTERALAIAKQMATWFREHYEDPAESVPYCSAEGGYQCELYGAREEIEGRFVEPEGTFSEDEWEAIIAAAVHEVEGDWETQTTEWAKVIVDEPEEPAPDEGWLLRAADHYWGKGHVHRFVFDDHAGTTLCGRTRAACPGEMDFGDQADVTCKTCLAKIERQRGRS